MATLVFNPLKSICTSSQMPLVMSSLVSLLCTTMSLVMIALIVAFFRLSPGPECVSF